MRTRLTPGEKPCRKRMATLACAYDTEPSPRRPHDIIAPPGGRHGHRTLRPRPRATAKWLAGSVRHDPAEVIAAAFSQAEARDPRHQRTWVVLADGAEHQLDLIRAEAQRRGVTIHIVIDLIHVLEYIWNAAWSLHSPGDPAAEDWVAVKALAVLAGDSTRAAAEITTETETAGLTAAQRTGADACVRYLTGKNEFLCYDQALAAGWPIATGVIEGACRHLIGDRLDITGARWGLDGAEAILTLRAVISNGDFDDYRGYHLAREHQRLYPGTTQGQSLRVTLSLTPNEPHPSAICNCFRPDMPLPLSTDRNRTRSSDGARIRALHPRQVGRAAKQAVQVQLPRRADRATADQEIATMHQLLRMPLAPVKLPDGGPPRRTSRSHDSALVNALAARRCTEHE